jgi:hypothetical protein
VLPDFSWYNIPKLEKYTKWPQNIPNGHELKSEMLQMAYNIPTFSIPRPSKIYLKLYFWSENTRTIWQPWLQ